MIIPWEFLSKLSSQKIRVLFQLTVRQPQSCKLPFQIWHLLREWIIKSSLTSISTDPKNCSPALLVWWMMMKVKPLLSRAFARYAKRSFQFFALSPQYVRVFKLSRMTTSIFRFPGFPWFMWVMSSSRVLCPSGSARFWSKRHIFMKLLLLVAGYMALNQLSRIWSWSVRISPVTIKTDKGLLAANWCRAFKSFPAAKACIIEWASCVLPSPACP